YTINGWGITDADYAFFNISRDIELRFDGWHTKAIAAEPDTYEWWYFDIQSPDGTTITGTFATTPTKGFVPRFGEPVASVNLSYSTGGPTRTEEITFPLDQFIASEAVLDVQAGPVAMKGDLQTLRITGEINGLAIDVTFEQEATPLRFGNGYVLVGSPERYRGWFNPFPQARATGAFTIDGQEIQIDGAGYHDHNWGNMTAGEGTVGWLWAKADLGRYVALAVRNQVRERFGGGINRMLWIYDLEDQQELVRAFGTDEPSLHVTEGNFVRHPDPLHGEGYPSLTIYDYWSGDDRARVIFNDTGVLDGFVPYNQRDPQIQQFLTENGTNGLYYTRRVSEVTLDLNLPSLGITDSSTGGALHELQESYFPQYIAPR
ncbi:MAG: hypothetical protein ACRDJC_17000, partial [Thermomicrobiales bacterium]